jgi:hypothetical protein
MNKVEFSNTNKKAAIVTYNTRLTLSSSHIRATGVAYMREYILDILGREVCDILSIPHNEDADRKYYKDIRDFESGKYDINYYDEVFIYNSQCNAFGGAFPVPSISTMFTLIKFKGDIWYMLTDPSMPPVNVMLHVRNKFKFCSEPSSVKLVDGTTRLITDKDINDFTENVFKRTRVAFCGINYKTYFDSYCNAKRVDSRKLLDIDWAYFGQHEYYSLREFIDLKLQTPEKEQECFDFAYCGNRRSSRDGILKEIIAHSDLKCALVGYGDSITSSNVSNIKYMPHEEMFDFINKHVYSTIIMGDNLHNNNIITPRFYESMLLNVVAFICHKYDSNKQFVKNSELKDFIYVNSIDELYNKINVIKSDKNLFKHIVELERKEVLESQNINDIDSFISSVNTDVLHRRS